MSEMTEQRWTQTITPRRGLLEFRLGELWRYRHLVFMFVRRDLVAGYKQTILGPLWLVIPPLISTVVFTIVFGNIAQLSSDGMPHTLFYMSGIMMWGFFNACVVGNATTFTTQSGIFSKVYFPRLIVNVGNVISTLISTTIQFLMFGGFVAYYVAQDLVGGPSVAAFLLPLLLLISAGLAIGVGVFLSAITAKYRDLGFLVTYGMQLWMYATTVIYPLSSVPDNYRLLALLNPMTSIIETFRYAFLGSGAIPWGGLAYAAAFGSVSLLVGLIVFNLVERTAMDLV